MSELRKNSGKNGKIELWRFLFCIIIMTFHIGDDILGLDYRIAGDISLFSKGQFAVEFFFVLSGFLMASSAFKNRNNGIGTGRDTFNFMQRKLMAVLPYHLMIFFITLSMTLKKRITLFQTKNIRASLRKCVHFFQEKC